MYGLEVFYFVEGLYLCTQYYRNDECDVRSVPDVNLNVCTLSNVSSLMGVAASLQRNTRPDRHCRLPVFRGCREFLCKSNLEISVVFDALISKLTTE